MFALIQVISGPEEGLSLVLKEGQTAQIGRGPKNNLMIAHDSYVSTSHAQVTFQNGVLQLCDLRSSNGSVINGRRVPGNLWQEIKSYFVLGSTPFRADILKKAVPAQAKGPIHVSSAKWAKSRLVTKALEFAEARGQKHLDSVSLFLAVIELFPEVIQETFQRLSFQSQSIFTTIKSHKVFEGSISWLNNYLELQSTLPKSSVHLASPKVVNILGSASARRGLKAEEALLRILGDSFNLVFPLIDWKRHQKTWKEYLVALEQSLKPASKKQVTLNEPPTKSHAATKKASVGAQIDLEIEAILQKGQIVELCGGKGCGKSRVLNRFLDAQFMRADESRERFLPSLMDIRTFLTFHNISELPTFVRKLKVSLRKAPLVGIDHFDELLDIMNREYLDVEELLSAIHSRECHLILATSSKVIGSKVKIHGVQRIDVSSFSLLLRQSILDAMMRRFERESGFRISATDRKWLNEQLWDMASDYHRVRQVFDLSVSRARDALEQRQKWSPGEVMGDELEKFPFEYILKELANLPAAEVEEVKPLPPPTPPEAIPALSSPDPGSVMDFVYQVEDFIKAFVEDEFHLGLDYTDRTYSIRESGILTQKEKLQQLKSFLVFLLSSYRESFRVWFQKFWNQIDPQTLKTMGNIGNNPKKLWLEFQQRAGKIDMALAEDQFIEMAAESFRRSWREARRSQVPPIPPPNNVRSRSKP